jgi:alpha-galactosidase
MPDLKPLLFTVFALLEGAAAVAAADSAAHVAITKVEMPFSFVYDGRSSPDLIQHWTRTETVSQLPGGPSLRTITYADPQNGLQVIAETTFLPGRNAVEWLLRMHNAGSTDTALIQDVRPMNLRIPVPASESVTMHYVLGSALRAVTPSPAARKSKDAFPCPDCSGAGEGEGLVGDFTPVDKPFPPGKNVFFSHYIFENGQHRESYLPFFNLQWAGGGLIGAIGWTGQWMVRSSRSSKEIVLESGQETTHFRLHPGESIRTPRVLMVEWHGSDWINGQNELRRVLIAHYLPRVNGEIPLPPVAHTNAYALIFDDIAKKTGQNPLDVLPTLRQADLGGKGGRGFADPGAALNYVTEKNQLEVIRNMPSVGIEAYWLDAGWFEGGWPGGRGSWVPNKNFPDGLRPLGDAAHKRGMKFLLWFDPEGVAPGSIIAKEHPEWVLHQPKEGPWGGIFRFGDPDASKWMTNLLSARIRDWGVDIYRNDRNTNPLPFWQYADAPDRQGITEIQQIEGLYALWDGLLERFPKLEIDNANWRVTGPDLEVMKRSIGSLTRSELTSGGIPHSIADQAQTAELSLWIPLDANLLHAMDAYSFRSTATTGVGIGLDLQSPYVSADELRKAIAEVKELRPFWLGDYYPLTPINSDPSAWCAWQFYRPDLRAGFATFFRRPKSAVSAMPAGLRGLDSRARYAVTVDQNYAPAVKRVLSGTDLSRLQVSISPAQSVVIRYRELGRATESATSK